VLKQINFLRLGIATSLVLLGLCFANIAAALEFRSVAVNKAILYDAPSEQAKKLFILSEGYPVEVIVNLGEWIKIRDHYGTLSWIQGKQLSAKRTVLVVGGKAEVRQLDSESSPLLATLEKDVVIDVVSTNAQNGWIKVKHRDGVTGFIRVSQVWGYLFRLICIV
jgi:SH3-like domain-containing protein